MIQHPNSELDKSNKISMDHDVHEVTDVVLKAETDFEANSLRQKIFTNQLRMKPLHVLIVDDSLSAQSILNQIFSKHSHTVIQAQSGEVAFSMVMNSIFAEQFGVTFISYDIVMVTDMIRDENGGNLCKRLRDVGYKGIILGMMGNPLRTDVERHIRNGANAVFPKPIKSEQLWKCINGL